MTPDVQCRSGLPRKQCAIPVRQVTLVEDRARVRRRGEVELEAGRWVVVVEDVSPIIVDKTLVVDVEDDASVVTVEDSRIERFELALRSQRPDEMKRIEEELTELRRKRDRLSEETRAHERRTELLEGIERRTLEDLAVNVSFGSPIPEQLDNDLKILLEERLAAERALADARFRLDDGNEEIHDLERRLRELETPSTSYRGRLEIQLHVTRAGRYPLSIAYLVPGACWRPYHAARLEADRVVFVTDGCVWQNTGEDWSEVDLVFSTERPSLGTVIPQLKEDRLNVRPKEAGEQLELRNQEITTAGLGGKGQARSAIAEVPGVDDGGDVRQLKAAVPASVPSDGHPHRVLLDTFETPVVTEVVSFPQLRPCAILRTEGTNLASHALLAGPVDLVRTGGVCGRTTLMFVAPGERFELGWGPVASLRTNRNEEVKRSEPGMLSSWGRDEHRVVIKLSNLGGEDEEVLVRERVPVSEVDSVKVTVERDASSPGMVGPDEDGFLSWRQTVEAGKTCTIRLLWCLERHKSVSGL